MGAIGAIPRAPALHSKLRRHVVVMTVPAMTEKRPSASKMRPAGILAVPAIRADFARDQTNM